VREVGIKNGRATYKTLQMHGLSNLGALLNG
jgi:hypothetical protein